MNKDQIRADFPILNREVNGNPLVYFDNAASSQKPRQVIDSISHYYLNTHSNVHRGVHALSQEATNAFEAARAKAARFVNAKSPNEIIFTTGTTEGINLVASSFGHGFLEEGDEVIISQMEHHSNMVPWQMICSERKAKLNIVLINDHGELDLDQFHTFLSEKTKLVALSHVSNSLGTINPVKECISAAHGVGAAVLIDGAQSAPHMKLDMQDLDADFYAISGHKMLGPTGTGFLYGKYEWLEKLPPYKGGGEMIRQVTLEGTTYNDPPFKFEAGTPNVAGCVGLGAAIDYIEELGMDNIQQEENRIVSYAEEALKKVEGIRFIGQAANKGSLVSFLVDGTHPYDVGTILDQLGIAVRTGHHCTEPVMQRYKIPGTIRASFAFYNTAEEVDCLVEGIEKAKSMLL